MGNCCSCTATVPSSPSPPLPVASLVAAGSVTPVPVLSQPEEAGAPLPKLRSRTKSMPKPELHTIGVTAGVSSQDSNPRIRAVSVPEPPQSKSSVLQTAPTRPQPVAASYSNRFDFRTFDPGESDD